MHRFWKALLEPRLDCFADSLSMVYLDSAGHCFGCFLRPGTPLSVTVFRSHWPYRFKFQVRRDVAQALCLTIFKLSPTQNTWFFTYGRAEDRRSFITPTVREESQVTPQRAPPVGFELEINGFQFYAIANLDKTSLKRNSQRARGVAQAVTDVKLVYLSDFSSEC